MVDVENMVDHGDVILVVGSGDDIRKLKVNSHVMRIASRFFTTLLGPNFSEGQNLSFREPKEISLPDDNPSLMTSICRVLHHKREGVYTIYPSGVLLDMAILVDKYGMHNAFYLHFSLWLANSYGSLGTLLHAAVLVHDEGAVKRITRKLVMDSNENLDNCYIPETGYGFAIRYNRLIRMIADRESELRLNLVDALFKASTFVVKHDSCSCVRKYAKELVLFLELKQLSYFANKATLAWCLSRLNDMPHHGHVDFVCTESHRLDEQPVAVRNIILGAIHAIEQFEGFGLPT